MSAPEPAGPRSASPLPIAVIAFAFGAFGLLGGLPEFAGVAVGVGGVLASEAWRRTRPWSAPTASAGPAVGALIVLAVTAPATTTNALAAGFCSIALLLWLALDPTRLAGAGRRAAPTIGYAVAALAVAWGVTVSLPSVGSAIGVAGGLLAAVVLVLVALLEWRVRADDGPALAGPAVGR